MPQKKDHNITLKPVRITRLIKISRDAYVLSFPRTFDFKAGQVIAIGLNEEDDPRVYSIASGADDPDIDILFNVNPEGHLTPSLARMKPGGFTQNKRLIHGGRYLDSFYFDDEFSAALGNNFIRCCSQERAPGIYTGRVTSYLENLPEPIAKVNYYLCGKAEMVIECRDILLIKGIPFMNILSEVYF